MRFLLAGILACVFTSVVFAQSGSTMRCMSKEDALFGRELRVVKVTKADPYQIRSVLVTRQTITIGFETNTDAKAVAAAVCGALRKSVTADQLRSVVVSESSLVATVLIDRSTAIGGTALSQNQLRLRGKKLLAALAGLKVVKKSQVTEIATVERLTRMKVYKKKPT